LTTTSLIRGFYSFYFTESGRIDPREGGI